MDTGARIRQIYTRIINGKRVKQSTLDKYDISYDEVEWCLRNKI